MVTPEEFANRDAIGVRTFLSDADGTGDVLKQDGNTGDLIFSVPQLVSNLSQTLTLFPGDIIFTGTPSGVGIGKKPAEFLKKGQTLITRIETIGELRNRLV